MPTRWDDLYPLYADTFARHGHAPYLTHGFFLELARTLPAHLMLKVASLDDALVGLAIFLVGSDTLYGRYWGSERQLPQPAFRDLLLPGHRLLHRARPCALRAGNARRAQGRARVRADAVLFQSLDCGSALRGGDRRLPCTRGCRSGALHGRRSRTRPVQARPSGLKRLMAQLVWLSDTHDLTWFPPVSQALKEPDGLLAAGGGPFTRTAARGLPPRHLSLVQRGTAGALVVARSAQRALPRRISKLAQPRTRACAIAATERASTRRSPQCVDACAEPRASGPGTWITPEMAAAYRRTARARSRAFDRNLARRTQLVGGLYGVSSRASILRRIDVQPRNGRFQSGARRLVDECRRARHRANRLSGRAQRTCKSRQPRSAARGVRRSCSHSMST